MRKSALCIRKAGEEELLLGEITKIPLQIKYTRAAEAEFRQTTVARKSIPRATKAAAAERWGEVDRLSPPERFASFFSARISCFRNRNIFVLWRNNDAKMLLLLLYCHVLFLRRTIYACCKLKWLILFHHCYFWSLLLFVHSIANKKKIIIGNKG